MVVWSIFVIMWKILGWVEIFHWICGTIGKIKVPVPQTMLRATYSAKDCWSPRHEFGRSKFLAYAATLAQPGPDPCPQLATSGFHSWAAWCYLCGAWSSDRSSINALCKYHCAPVECLNISNLWWPKFMPICGACAIWLAKNRKWLMLKIEIQNLFNWLTFPCFSYWQCGIIFDNCV